MRRVNMKEKRSVFVIVTVLAVISGSAGLVQSQGRRFKSPGEQIYYSGIGSNGYHIFRYGGPMWIRMHGGGCISCHGIHGKGGVPVMMGTAIPTDIRYEALTGKEKHVHGGKEQEHHYTDVLIKRAITQGLAADGKLLDWTMPRWQMSEADLDALIDYLKTLK
jgi:hypothetical protein